MTVEPQRELTIAIVARLTPGLHGGVDQAVQGMVAGLGRLLDGDEAYVIAVDDDYTGWLDPYVGPNSRIARGPKQPRRPDRDRMKAILGPGLPAVRRLIRGASKLATVARPSKYRLAPPDPFIESVAANVVHFPYQQMHDSTAPLIFNPHDVQHLYFPEFFDTATNEYRRRMYSIWCNASAAIEVPSAATKRDLVTRMCLPAEKIVVVRRGAPTMIASGAAPCIDVRRLYSIPPNFIYYPAQTWPHKNHLRLLEALALLRDRHGVELPLVCTGRLNDYWPVVGATIEKLGQTGQVQFLGLVPSDHVRALYRAAEFMVFPTLFEGGGFPLTEAFGDECPVACSDLPVLREQGAEACLYFDPTSTAAIASALNQMHWDGALRDRIRRLGKIQGSSFTWERTARTYRALYRELARRALTDEDVYLLRAARAGVTGEVGHRVDA